MECWGAQGGFGSSYESSRDCIAGNGAYTRGSLNLEVNTTLYIYVGQQGVATTYSGAWNGGGYKGGESRDGSGGGATDIRLAYNPSWNAFASLKTRIMVAAGGGGADDGHGGNSFNPHAGGLHSNTSFSNSNYTKWTNASQNAPGSINSTVSGVHVGGSGKFGSGNMTTEVACCGGGGGWYGGAGSDISGMGGSSFISGHEGCIAILSTSTENNIVHRSESNARTKSTYVDNNNISWQFNNTLMIDGAGKRWNTDIAGAYDMPAPSGGTETGHSGNGYCKITWHPAL